MTSSAQLRRALAAVMILACEWSYSQPTGTAPQVRVELRGAPGEASVSCESIARFTLRLTVDPGDEKQPLTIRVELPETGRNVWPAEDVHVTTADGRAMSVRRDGIEWHRIEIEVPATPGAYIVEAVPPTPGILRPEGRHESSREAEEPQSGLRATACRWFDGRTCALSIRFDDAHPSHLTHAIPVLREFGFRGTFMLNPGSSAYQGSREAWEAVAERGDQEFANHTMRHRGAGSDEEVEREVGDASKYISGLFPHRSRLLALNRGGGTSWVTTRPFREWLDECRLFIAGGSLGMDDVYDNRVAAFRTHLEQHIDRGGWCRAHFHSIGEGLASSEDNFRAALEVVKEHEQELWVTGLADAYKYQTARQATSIALQSKGQDAMDLSVSSTVDASVFDQPLTIELALPEAWRGGHIVVADSASNPLACREVAGSGGARLRFDVPPVDAIYSIRNAG